MAAPTAYRHQGMIALNRPNGGLVMLTMEEAVAVAALVSPAADARDAVQRHLDQQMNLIGRAHSDPRSQV